MKTRLKKVKQNCVLPIKKNKKKSLKLKEGILKDRKKFCVHPFAKLSFLINFKLYYSLF